VKSVASEGRGGDEEREDGKRHLNKKGKGEDETQAEDSGQGV